MAWARPLISDMRGQGVTGLALWRYAPVPLPVEGRDVMRPWAFGATFVVFKVVNAVKSMRVAPEIELEGLDVPEFGLLGYPEDPMVTATAASAGD